MKYLSAPWRWKFISQLWGEKKCIFCEALNLPAEKSLVIYRGENFFVILNKYPYSTGHLMVVPVTHLKSPDLINGRDVAEMWDLMNRAISILREQFHPDGFNIGMNVGKSAGAGVDGHFHLHLVPRWSGDTNFMAVTGKTKVLSYDIQEISSLLRREFQK
jgi:ATP adenylyltransferase